VYSAEQQARTAALNASGQQLSIDVVSSILTLLKSVAGHVQVWLLFGHFLLLNLNFFAASIVDRNCQDGRPVCNLGSGGGIKYNNTGTTATATGSAASATTATTIVATGSVGDCNATSANNDNTG